MKIYLILAICSVFISCRVLSQKSYNFQLDIPIASSGLKCNKNFDILIRSSQTLSGKECQIDNFKIIVGIDKYSNIVYYSSNDSNFLINKFKYLSNEQNYLDSIKRYKLIYERGWAAYIPIEQGWNLAFNFSDVERTETNDFILKKDARPIFVFKRSKEKDKNSRLSDSLKKYGVKVDN